MRSADILDVEVDEQGAAENCVLDQGVHRLANRLFKTCARLRAQVKAGVLLPGR